MTTPRRERLLRRLRVHHLPIGAGSAVCIALLYATRPYKDVLTKASFATAYPALVLLAATLWIGPWNLLRGRRTPVSSDLRRDVGIWAGILSLVHTALGQNVHLRGRPWLYYIYEHRSSHIVPLRHDLFGLANFTGLISAIILLALLATSNDYSIRALSTPRWKQLQRWTYFAFALAGFHAIGYEAIEKQKALFVAFTIACLAITVLVRALGSHRRRERLLNSSSF